nr:MAG: hypothetical protein [uncultured cyanophage]
MKTKTVDQLTTGYLVINDEGCKIKVDKTTLTLAELQNIVGIEGESAYIEAVYKLFSDRTIVIMVDEEGLLTDMPISLSMKGLTLVGQIIIGSFDQTEDSEDQFKPLTVEQIKIVLKETGLKLRSLK